MHRPTNCGAKAIAILPSIGGKPVTFKRILRSIRARLFDEPINSCRGVFDTFAEAAKAAPKSRPLGYDAADSADWYLTKLSTLSLEDYPVAFWLRTCFANSRSIFEVGGHIGVAYYGLERVLKYPADLTWTICDVPTIAAAGEALAKERGRTNLSFVSSPIQTEGADVFLASGALQYFSMQPAEMIATYKVRPKHVIINTTPICDGPGFVTVQYIGTAYCAYRIFGRSELVASLKALGYTLVDSWRKEREFRIPGHPDKSFDHYTGMYFRADSVTATGTAA